jgi:hypothetical protein
LLPAGAVAGWDLHPLESAALSRRTPHSDIHRDLYPNIRDALTGWVTSEVYDSVIDAMIHPPEVHVGGQPDPNISIRTLEHSLSSW